MSADINVLLVDDEEMVLNSIRGFFELETDYNLFTSTNPTEAISILVDTPMNVIISDYLMPDMNGIEFLIEAKNKQPKATRIMLTGYADKENAIRAINEADIYQYIEKPWDNDQLLIVIKNAIERTDLLAEIQQKYEEIRKAYVGTIFRLAAASEMFDEGTYSHLMRISRFSEKLAVLSGEDGEFCYNIRYASIMHDVGKVGVPRRLLTINGRLETDEFSKIKLHADIGSVILRNPENMLLEMANQIAHYHHERWNGNGYPEGLKGEEIPKAARITAIVDVFDALMSERPYKPPYDAERVRKIIGEEAGEHFEPKLAALFLEHFEEFVDIYRQISSLDRDEMNRLLFE